MFSRIKYQFSKILNLLETLRNSYWFVPTLMLIGGLILSLQMLDIENDVKKVLGDYLPWVVMIDSKGMADVISVIAGSIITVTGVVFSITMVTLTLASSQFGPRLLRNFLRDRISQVTFGTFLATFVYNVMILSTLTQDSIPQGASLFAIFLVLINMFVLIFFIHHTATSIQVSSIINSVAKEYDEVFEDLYKSNQIKIKQHITNQELMHKLKHINTNYKEIIALNEGYIRLIDYNETLEILNKNDIFLRIDVLAGDYVYAGQTLGVITPAGHIDDFTTTKISKCFLIGEQRTPMQDLRYLISQLIEIALRALSPGINDPLTAIECIQKFGSFLSKALKDDVSSTKRFDSQGKVRIIGEGLNYELLLNECFNPIRIYGSSHVKVTYTILNILIFLLTICEKKKDTKNYNLTKEYMIEVYNDFCKLEHNQTIDMKKINNIIYKIKTNSTNIKSI